MDDAKMKNKNVVEVTEDIYQPTRAELDEEIQLKVPEGMSLNNAVKRLLRPVEFHKISAKEQRARRSRDSA